jgi:glycosyltransferase involved in cell wall biosynthesis
MRISIVTPTLNRARFLPAAFASVAAQEYPEVEHFVVDGMSTDGTVELLAQHPALRVIREPDSGLWDALNKGIRAATGEIVGHLNSDDEYAPGTFRAVAEAFADPRVEAVSGGAEILEAGGKVRHRFVQLREIELTFENVTMGALIPNARFFRRSFYERVGLYDPRYRVAADREFLFRAVLAQPCARTVGQIFYRYGFHEDSLTFSDNPEREARWREEYLALAEGYLDRADLPAAAHAGARRWHLRESAQAATRALLGGHPGQAAGYAARGCRRNAGWPIMFARHLGGALLHR